MSSLAVEYAYEALCAHEPVAYEEWKEAASLTERRMQRAVRRLQDTGRLDSHTDATGRRFYESRDPDGDQD